MEATEFVPLTEAAETQMVHEATLRRRFRLAGLPLYRDPSDHRRRLVRRTDLDELATPRPLLGGGKAVAMTA